MFGHVYVVVSDTTLHLLRNDYASRLLVQTLLEKYQCVRNEYKLYMYTHTQIQTQTDISLKQRNLILSHYLKVMDCTS